MGLAGGRALSLQSLGISVRTSGSRARRQESGVECLGGGLTSPRSLQVGRWLAGSRLARGRYAAGFGRIICCFAVPSPAQRQAGSERPQLPPGFPGRGGGPVPGGPDARVPAPPVAPPRASADPQRPALRLRLQHQPLSDPAAGPGPGAALPGRPRLPGLAGPARRQQGAAHHPLAGAPKSPERVPHGGQGAAGRVFQLRAPGRAPEPHPPVRLRDGRLPARLRPGPARLALTDGTLYAGMRVDFMGTDAALFRTMGPRPAVRTEQHDSRWLYDPVFLRAHVIPDSSAGSDDKLYFFFREKALEGAVGPAVLARVGRVCLNDDGGQRALLNKWTTFLKARLVCSVVGEDGVETFFDELRDVFLLPTQDAKNPRLYGLFSTLGSVFRGSAVCTYPLSAIRTVFNGPFAHREGHNHQWVPYTGRVPYPRPGACPGGTFTPGLRSTREFPDELLAFVRAHPLMYSAVYPPQRRPLLVRANVPYTFTALAVDLVDAVDGRYEVFFLGTDRGTVQKVLVLPTDPGVPEEVTLEEVEVFKPPAPVTSLWISSKRHQLYVSSDAGLAQLSLHRCGAYGPACADCCLARDPYCAWDGRRCAPQRPGSARRVRRQDVRHGDPHRQCRGFSANEPRLAEQVQFGVEGGSVFLECRPRSPHTQARWLLQVEGGARRPLPQDRVLLQTPQGVLLGPVAPSDGGRYQCVGTERGYRRLLRTLRLHVLPHGQLGGAGPPHPICKRQWARDLDGAWIGTSQGAQSTEGARIGPELFGTSPGGLDLRWDRIRTSRRSPPRH